MRTDANAITAAGRGYEAFAIYVVYSAASSELITASRIEIAVSAGA